jgi:hypothetical protein
MGPVHYCFTILSAERVFLRCLTTTIARRLRHLHSDGVLGWLFLTSFLRYPHTAGALGVVWRKDKGLGIGWGEQL